MKSPSRIRRLLLTAVVTFGLAALLSAVTTPVLAHNGVVHGDQPEQTQTMPDEPKETTSPAVSDTEATETDTAPTNSAEAVSTPTHLASIGIGEILLGSIVLGPIALIQLRTRL